MQAQLLQSFEESGVYNTATVGDFDLISDNYATGVSGWRISPNGDAEFQNVTVRGSIYSSIGNIGGFTIDSNSLNAGTGSSFISFQNGGTPGLVVGGQSLAPYMILSSTDMIFATLSGETKAILQNSSSQGELHLYGNTQIDLEASNGLLEFGNDTRISRTGISKLLVEADASFRGNLSIEYPYQPSFGFYVGTPVVSAGYITIKDSNGVSRKLMVGV